METIVKLSKRQGAALHVGLATQQEWTPDELKAVGVERDSALLEVGEAKVEPVTTSVPARRAMVTLLYGTNPNVTVMLKVQLQSMQQALHQYDHVTMVTADVPMQTRKSLEAFGSRCIEIQPVTAPDSAFLYLDPTLRIVWNNVFSKLLIWNLTQYEQVVFIDTDAYLTGDIGSANSIFHDCGAHSFCAVHDNLKLTPAGNPLLNAGMMVVRPSKVELKWLMGKLAEYIFLPGSKTPEQVFLSDVYSQIDQIKWLSARYNYGCHDPKFIEPEVSPDLGYRLPDVFHMCGHDKLPKFPLCLFNAPQPIPLQPTQLSTNFMLMNEAHSEVQWPCNSLIGIQFQRKLLEVESCTVFNSFKNPELACSAAKADETIVDIGMTLKFPLGCHWCSHGMGCFSKGVPCFKESAESEAADRRNHDVAIELTGKSIYMVMVDRFAAVDASTPECGGERWCGGTLAGLTAKLDYIQGMGFDCIWITPVVQQPHLGDNCKDEWCALGYHGYWAEDLYTIDSRFGTPLDLKNLSREAKKRGMCLMMDMVLNHMRPIGRESDLMQIKPFNESKHYHTYRKPDSMSFSDYAAKPIECIPTPCIPGDYNCKPDGDVAYDPQRVQDGWFPEYRYKGINMPDLRQEDPMVANELTHWVKYMVAEYKLDAIRLDTAAYLPTKFLEELRNQIEVEILGEVTAGNWSFLSGFYRDPNTSLPVLDALTNFNLFGAIVGGFCGFPEDRKGNDTFLAHSNERVPLEPPDLASFSSVLYEQQRNTVLDLDRLSIFLDTHDEARIAHRCNDTLRVRNALAFLMMWHGMPVVYQGTEQGFDMQDRRVSLWQTGFPTNSRLYSFISKMNHARKAVSVGLATILHADEHILIFQRSSATNTIYGTRTSLSSSIGVGSAFVRRDGNATVGDAGTATNEAASVIVFLNNWPATEGDSPRSYCVDGMTMPPPAPKGLCWVDVLTETVAEGDHGCFEAADSEPKVLHLLACPSG